MIIILQVKFKKIQRIYFLDQGKSLKNGFKACHAMVFGIYLNIKSVFGITGIAIG